MAHYDCDNCGEHMGIAFGYCSACTPKEYHDLQNDMAAVIAWADERWEQHVKAETTALAARKSAFITDIAAEAYAPLMARRHALKMEHDRSYRDNFERAERTRMIHPISGEEIHVEPGAQIPLFHHTV